MPRVGVVGGGKAGRAAAAEAASSGADVVLFERRSNLGGHESSLTRAGAILRPREPVIAVGPGPVLMTQARPYRFDSVVVATGSSLVPPRISGLRKKGVFLVDGANGVEELSAALSSVQMALVCGDGLPALALADKVRGRGRAVTVLTRRPLTEFLPEAIATFLLDSAGALGVRVVLADPERVVGLDSAEAVVASGKVFPCDSFICIPQSRGSVPRTDLVVSPRGRLVVDSSMKTSDPCVYAAGSCAESSGSQGSGALAPISSGRVAGRNAVGGTNRQDRPPSWSATMFGVHLSSWGLTLQEALRADSLATSTERTLGPRTACSVVYDSASGKVLGVQLAGDSYGSSSSPLPFFVDDAVDLSALSHLDEDSTDISPISETARQEIAWRSESADKGPGLRPRRS